MALASLRARWEWIPPLVDGMLDARRGMALEPIRSELFGVDRLAQHGHSLGSTHRAGPARFGQATFYPRLQSNVRTLRAAYQFVAQEAQTGQDISPAAEWLFDNFQLIEAQLREIREGLPARFYRSLPVLLDAPLAGLPRIYGVAWDYVAHTDSAFDEDLLVRLLDAYQDARELSQGELWALPTTLRVVLVENLRRLADRIASQKAARELASLCALRINSMGLPELQALHTLMVRRGVGPEFLCALVRALIGRVAMPGEDGQRQAQAWLKVQVPDLAALQAQEAADQAADHLSVGNAVTALRRIGAADWQDIVSRSSRVIREMLASPVFAAEDDTTRNATLHAIERLSVHSGHSGAHVARELIHVMGGTRPPSLASHWLQGDGRPELERTLGVRQHRRGWWRPLLRVSRTPAYLGALALGSAGLVAAWLPGPVWATASPAALAHTALTGLLMLLPASEAVGALVNRLISESVPPVHLPRLLLAKGIPPEAQVMVVIPALLGHRAGIDALVRRLQLHHLANPEAHAQFALLSDWTDADTEHHPDDDALLAHAADALRALNRQHPVAADAPARFLLLHRARTFSATQAQWLGWERKRGKLQQLVARLATGEPGPFFDLGELSCTAPHTRYVLTLDSDTQLPPGRLRALVGVAEHPQNRPVLDAGGRRVLRGYGILQPHLIPPLPTEGVQTPWQWLFAGQSGIDPYSAMSSDAYQDLFGEGSFTGKGLLHVATLHAVLGERLPTERILSHDLLEGALVRCAVVSDVTLLEAEPEHSDADAARQHRWMRGDWQLLPFLWQYRRWPLGAINRWKLVDNLRRSLVPPAALALTVLSLGGLGLSLPVALVLAVTAYTAGPLMGALAAWVPRRWDLAGERFVVTASLDLLRALAAGLWQLALLPQHALRALDAVLRTAHRLARSHRQLLQWTTAEAAQADLGTDLWATLRRHRAGPLMALAGAAALWVAGLQPGALGWTLLALWATAPLVVWAANRSWAVHPLPLSAADREWLHGVARDTWRLFERTVDAPDHHLPPDNLQSAPYEMVAHRTSPTNIGLYLLSAACARRFGWIGTQDLLTRLEATLATLHRLERHRGHFLNWYDTRTLLPLPPRYVSTVDSGNLCVHLLAVAQACRELTHDADGRAACAQAIVRSHRRLQPLQDLLPQRLHRPLAQTALGRLFAAEPLAPGDTPLPVDFPALLQAATIELESLPPTGHPGIVDRAPTALDELQWLLGDHLATWRSALRDQAAADAGCDVSHSHTHRRLLALADAFEALAWAADFRFLYHPRRHLLHIGYRPDDQLLDTAFYDLLASESRSTSLLAIAKGDVPVKHWTALGRPFFASGQHVVLRSWSGSMFEYLMPTLVMTEPRGSALGEAAHSALREQRASVRATGLPWGQSESAYAVRDQTLAYQYAPQGVARLALRRTPPAEHVVAPYASVLATLVDPRAACTNLRLLCGLGARGRYGLFEALDYTPARQSHGHAHTLVRTSMAHHQGMSIVALANLLHGGVAQRWGMAHPRLQAVASLLHERAPRELAPPLPLPGLVPQELHPRVPEPVRALVPGEQALEPTHLLSNGRYTVTLRPGGAGWSRHGQTGITRWRDDALRDANGSFLYLRRDAALPPVSLTSHPAPDPSARYLAHFHTDRVVFDAAWDDLRVSTTVWVSPEDDIELRQVVLHHDGDEPIELELISAFDVTLASHAADEAHPAFSGLFVQADWLPSQQALRFARTPRLPTEGRLQAAHFVASTQGELLELRCQTDRARWLGRHHPASQPLADLQAVPLGPETLTTGLDPVAALGVRLRMAPGTQACVTFATAASEDAATLMAVVDKYRQPSYVERSSVMSATLTSIPVASGRPHTQDLPALHALTTALVLTLPRVAMADPGVAEAPPVVESDRRLLWPLGLSGTRPLVLVTAGPTKGMGLLRALVQAQREWARAGVPCDLVVLSHEAHSYHMPLQHELTLMTEQPGSVPAGSTPTVSALHRLRFDQLSPDQLATLQRLARVHLVADGRPLLAQVGAWSERHATPTASAWKGLVTETVPVRRLPASPGPSSGHFGPDGRDFGFTVGADQQPTRPWINVLANPGFGCMVSDSGAGPTWALNSRLNQLTAWSNDPVADPPGEWFLLQDRRSRDIWSVTPSAWGAQDVDYAVTHTQGLTSISHRRGALAVSVHWCVDPVTALKQVRIRLENQGGRKAHLRITGLVEWLLGEQRSDRATLVTQPCLATPPEVGLTGLLCTQTEAAAGLGGGTAFFCESHEGVDAPEAIDWTCDRRAFFDARGQLVLPQSLGQRSGAGLDPCAALSRPITLRPGAVIDQVFLIGHAASPEAARTLMRQAVRSPARAREQAAQAQWERLLGATQVHTPDPLFDALVNRWLLYQTVSSRLWAKAGFYQAGGATGYRDQLQDAMALVWADPALLHAQVLRCAARQFEEGDVQHWWHEPGGAGVRTHFSDDLLWLPLAIAHHVQATGDASLLDETAPFLTGPPVPEGAEDRYDVPAVSARSASVFEHGARAIDHSLRVGAHGLPLMGSGDWNDGMNRVGHEGRGESVWLGWFLCHIVRAWLPLALARGDHYRVERWAAALAGWRQALATQAWDGAWFKRAFFDDGSALGSHTSAEARIDLIAQAWAVLSGEATPERQHLAMQAVDTELMDMEHGLVRLLVPPLVDAVPSAGYIQAYPPGVRENGGQYTHAGAWALMAAALVALREPGNAWARNTPYRLFTCLSPAHRAAHPQWGPAYGLEPYAVAADVYSQPPYVGRGGWSWYTGAAGWLHRGAVESILGLNLQADELWFTPCLPLHWPRAELTLKRNGYRLHFVLLRADMSTALSACARLNAGLLRVDKRLRWREWPTDSTFVVPLD
ncbi:GH36-type glycosyl hydrolase domain-containing protein [Hydrogenophaga flava]|uniref:GH36-type glycosyl hydrolase domain-containing protein n=1 Tax=Hydrogenophaga flava TaxID=65657 RepID=UPI000B1C78B9|nr:glucoamylase family protein [Hydrogenophaga flava]